MIKVVSQRSLVASRNAFISPISTLREFGGNDLDAQKEEEAVDVHVLFRDDIAAEMNFDPDLCSNNLEYQWICMRMTCRKYKNQ